MNKEILRLAIPNIISNVSVPLLSTVDTALMGNFSPSHIAAVGVSAMIFNFIYWNFGFLRMGTTGISAQAYGKKDESAMILTLGRALIVAAVLAIVILSLQLPFSNWSFNLMNINPAEIGYVSEYFFIRIWDAPATLGIYVFMGWFFGMQNALFPLLITIVINVVNIAFSLLFIHAFEMEVAGVAYSTVIAQYTGLALAMFLFWYKYRTKLKHGSRKLLLEVAAFQQFLHINRDIFIRTFCLTFAFGFFYSQSSKMEGDILAINVILLQFVNWMSYGIDGFAYASESLVGKYKGAANDAKFSQAIRLSFYWGFIFALLFSFVYWLFGNGLLHIFTDEPDLVLSTKEYMGWVIAFPILAFACYIWDGIYIGMTASLAMRNAMILSLILFLVLFYTLPSSLGNHRLWLSLLVFMVIRGIVQSLLFWSKGKALV